MKTKVFPTDDSWAPLVLRLFLGLVIFPHGAQKLLGWFGGYGFSGTMGFFTDTLGLPWLLSLLVIILESVGAMALVVGVATRLVALSYIFLAIGIVFTSHIQYGFFMNWSGSKAGEGYEYFLLWIALAIALFLTGGGKFSVDRKLMANKSRI